MAVAETAAGAGNTIIFLIPGVILTGVVIILLWAMSRDKVKRKNDMHDIYKETVEDCKMHVPENIKYLYRVHIPPLDNFIGKITGTEAEVKKITEEIIEKLRELFTHFRRSVYLGEIIGFNEVDLLTTPEDYIVPKDMENKPFEAKGGETAEFTDQQKKEVEEIVKECGQFIYFIVFKPKKHSFFKLNPEVCLICFADQLLGLNSDDGDLAVLGQGSDRLASYFHIVSGYPRRIKVAVTHLIARGWISWAMRLENAHVETTETAMRMDANTAKGLAAVVLSNKSEKKEGDKT